MLKSKTPLKMTVVLTTTDEAGRQQHHHHVVELTFEEQRKLVEAEAGGPCFRMYLTADEYQRLQGAPEWCTYRLSDGRWAYWRPESEVKKLMAGGDKERKLAAYINSRRLGDDVL